MRLSSARRLTTAAVALTVLFAQFCVSRPDRDGLKPVLRRLPPDWVTVMDETGAYEMPVPRSARRAPTGKYFFVHGGEVWEDEHTKVSLSFGQWSEASFEEVPGERRHVQIGERPVLIIAGAGSVLAWYGGGTGGHEPVLNITSDRESIATLLGAALSLRYFEPPPSD